MNIQGRYKMIQYWVGIKMDKRVVNIFDDNSKKSFMDTVFVKLVFHKGFFVNHSFKIIFIKYIIRALKHQKFD